jgi:hypothetical protein
VSSDWQFILNETSVEFLLTCKARQREKLINALQQLAANPAQREDYEGRDSTGRSICLKLIEGFFITYWCDHYVKEVRVIRIERI